MLTIATFNIKNDFNKYSKEKSSSIIKFLKDKEVDILCLQELFPSCEKDLIKKLLKIKYNIYGKYRYKMKLFKTINESTSIITKKKVLSNKTYHLPFLPSTLKRVATKIIIEDEELGHIAIINTHLDYKYIFTKKRQLQKIISLIKNESHPIILTGDFNLKNNNPIFCEFIAELEKLGINRVPVHEKTFKESKYKRAIDHIFINEEFKVLEYMVIKDLSISDHYPVLVKIEKR